MSYVNFFKDVINTFCFHFMGYMWLKFGNNVGIKEMAMEIKWMEEDK
jgi:hypothetical protein